MFPETGLLKQWPEEGPKLAWSVQGLGKGFSSSAVVNGTIYVTGMDDQKQGCLFAFDLQGGPKWKTAYGPEFSQSGAPRPGSRGTPAVEGDQVFVVSSFGKLVVLGSAQGQVVQTIDLLERFKAGPAKFGFAESVLVDGQKVICTPGGPDASVVALDRNTGATIWQTQGLGQATGYCSARLIRHGDRPIVVTML
jgi:outer membrane protein assembly factor BamB